MELFTKAADAGLPDAQTQVGIMYIEGEGADKDPVEAFKWWTLAARQGDEDAKSNLDKLKPDLTPEQAAEGQRRAEAWKSNAPAAR